MWYPKALLRIQRTGDQNLQDCIINLALILLQLQEVVGGHISPQILISTKDLGHVVAYEGRRAILSVPVGPPAFPPQRRSAVELVHRPVGLLTFGAAILYKKVTSR